MEGEVQVAQGCHHLQIVPPAPDWGQEKTADSTMGGESTEPGSHDDYHKTGTVKCALFLEDSLKFTQFDNQGFLSSQLFLPALKCP